MVQPFLPVLSVLGYPPPRGGIHLGEVGIVAGSLERVFRRFVRNVINLPEAASSLETSSQQVWRPAASTTGPPDAGIAHGSHSRPYLCRPVPTLATRTLARRRPGHHVPSWLHGPRTEMAAGART